MNIRIEEDDNQVRLMFDQGWADPKPLYVTIKLHKEDCTARHRCSLILQGIQIAKGLSQEGKLDEY